MSYRIRDLINPLKWIKAFRWYFSGQYIKIKKEDFDTIAEVHIYRKNKCPQCFVAGKCIGKDGEKGCNCVFLGLSTDLSAECGLEAPAWTETTTEEWNEFKQSTGLKIKPTRK